MPAYDPQRNRPRARPSADAPIPIDALLGEVEPRDVPEPAHDHTHDHDHDHDHDHGPNPAAVLGAIAAAVLAWITLRRWRRRRRGS